MTSALPYITEIKETLSGERKTFRCRLVRRAAGEAVVMYVSDRRWQVQQLTLDPGTVTFGYFWEARPFNVYHWMRPDGVTLAYYVNLADETRIGDEELCWRDLTVDILFTPDGRATVLDEAELPLDLDAQIHARIEAAKNDVLGRALPQEIQLRSAALWKEVIRS